MVARLNLARQSTRKLVRRTKQLTPCVIADY